MGGSLYDGVYDSEAVFSSPFDSAARRGLKAMSLSPLVAATATLALTAGTVYVTRIDVAETITVSNVVTVHGATGSGTTGAFVSIHDSSLAKIVDSGDLGTAWNSGTTKNNPVSSTTLVGGPGVYYYVCLLAVGGTGPTLNRTAAANAALTNIGLGATSYDGATGGTGQSTIPSTPTLTSVGYKLFVALS